MTFRYVWAVYFSATGATKHVTEAIAGALAAKAEAPLRFFDFTLPNQRQAPPSFTQEDLVVFGMPVYAGRIPNLLLSYVASAQGGDALAVPVVLYGNRAYDDALIELRNVLEEGGFHTVAAGAFVGEHSFSRVLAGGRPDASDLTIAKGFAHQVFRKVAALPDSTGLSPVPVKGNNPIAPYFRPTDGEGRFLDIRKVKPATNDNCNNCKWCVRHCPMGAIAEDNVKEVTGICVKCNACVKGCPRNAKQFTDANYLFHRDDIVSRYQSPRNEPELFL